MRVVKTMRASGALTALLLTAAFTLAVGTARADTDISVRVGGSSGSVHYGYDADWWWGDSVLYGDWNYGRSGLYIGYRDGDWDARYRGSSRDTYGTHPNDRPGYRVFIPRGLEYPPEYYGDYSDSGRNRGRHHNNNSYSTGGVVILQPYGYNGNYYDPYYSPYYYPQVYSSRYPIVIDNTPRPTYTGVRVSTGGSTSRYTAPDAPEYGYPRPQADEDWDYQIDNQPTVINDNRTYNYYGDASAASQPAPSEASSRAVQTAGSNTSKDPEPRFEDLPPAPAMPPNERAIGGRFFDELRLDTPGGAVHFSLSGANLYAGPDVGPAVLVSDAADAGFGAFGAYIPGTGSVVVYRSGDKLLAAYPAGGGWQSSALPLSVDFAQAPSLGLVGNALWATATGRDGGRYVMAFSAGLWSEVGSGTPAPAQ